jgi:acetate CoA/acetoacetate CoA-transferase beta subunit
MGMAVVSIRERMAKRAAQEIKHGDVVNLGFGMPQVAGQYISPDIKVFFHAENGVLGAGPATEKGKEDPNLVDAGNVPITIVPGASFFDSATSFALVRSGRINITILGALEVSEKGDLANWLVPGGLVPGMGGAMDLALKAKRVIAMTTHTDKKGNPKIKAKCDLPLTALGCVSLIITDLAVIAVEKRGLVLKEIFDTTTVEEVVSKTGAKLIIEEPIQVITD